MNGKLFLVICFIAATLISCWHLKRTNNLSVSLKTFSYIGNVFFLGLAIFFVFTLSFYSIKNSYQRKEFTKSDWMEDREKRFELYDDLVHKRLLQNKTKEEMINLLGSPFLSKDSVFYYYLGLKPGLFAVDPEFLIIEFDTIHSTKFYTKRFS